jgi:hypothetical protein
MSGLGKMDTCLKNMAETHAQQRAEHAVLCATHKKCDAIPGKPLILVKDSWDHHAGMTEGDKLHQPQHRACSALVGELL